MRYAALIIWVTTLSPGAALAAQASWPVDIGRRVRLTTDSGPWIGVLVRQDSSGLTLHGPGLSDSAAVTVPLDRIRRIEISYGRQSNVGKGALIGFGVGAATGLALGLGCAASSDGIFSQCTGGEVAQGTLIFGFIGASLGGLVGLASTSERWEQVGTGPVHVSLASHGLGLAVSLAF